MISNLFWVFKYFDGGLKKVHIDLKNIKDSLILIVINKR